MTKDELENTNSINDSNKKVNINPTSSWREVSARNT
jgi:hypothetical protein